jgi:glycosyltransferase involved in cell wall biosynthesis
LPDAPTFVFAIPLIARSAAYDWDVVVHHFNATLGSIFNQTDPNFRVIVACTGRPEVRIPVDERLEFVDLPDRPFSPHDPEWSYRDIARRRHAVLKHAAPDGDAYVMLVDADDLVSCRLVSHVRQTNHQYGYLLTRGYIYDSTHGLLSMLPNKIGQSVSFFYSCGTSIVLRLTAEELRNSTDEQGYFRRVMRRGHPWAGKFSMAEGRPLGLIEFRAAVYVRNHGSNMSERDDIYPRSVLADRAAAVANIVEAPVPIDDSIRAEFKLNALQHEHPATVRAPKLTVAIVTWRRPAGLGRLLAALRPQVQGRVDRNIVVVNDGSHDAAYSAIVADCEGLIRYEPLATNSGIGAARNCAAGLADGDFVVYVDDDCLPPPFWLDWLAGRLAAEPDLDVLAGTTRLLWRHRTFFERVQAHFGIVPRPWVTQQDIIFVTANVAIRRTLLDRIGGFRPLRIGEDSELAGRVALAGSRVAYDAHWYVEHEPESLRVKLRKYWHYGKTNAELQAWTTAPAAYAAVTSARRSGHIKNARAAFREKLQQSDGFSPWRVTRVLAALVAALVLMAYYDGCAAGMRFAGRPGKARRQQALSA